MELINKLTNDDKEKINKYIYQYVNGTGSRASVDHLLRFWSDNKENLYHLFGDKFIISKPITYERPSSAIEQDIKNDILFKPNDFIFPSKFKLKVSDLYNDNKINYETRSVLCDLLEAEVLAVNEYMGKNYNFIYEDKKYIIQKGCKPMRMLGKMAKLFGLEEDFDKFRIAVSMTTNQRMLKGELCLSIHPLDFMTMSDNNENWSSCMSWIEDGCYKRGTVEMMNSRNVVVAYLKGKDGDIGPIAWNSKKWRTLLIVDPDMMVSVKAYPYQNATLAQEGLKMIAELNPDAYGPIKELPFERHFDYENHNAYFTTTTDAMYNDFGRDVAHYGAFSTSLLKEDKDIDLNINYSGESECMWCGGINSDFDSESDLVCSDCCDYVYCDDCGERIYDGDDSYEIDGEILCSYCYENNVVYDEISGEDHLNDNMEDLYLLPSNLKNDDSVLSHIKDYPSIETYREVLVSPSYYSRSLKGYFDDATIHCHETSAYREYYYVFADQLNEDGIKLYHYDDKDEMNEDLEGYNND